MTIRLTIRKLSLNRQVLAAAASLLVFTACMTAGALSHVKHIQRDQRISRGLLAGTSDQGLSVGDRIKTSIWQRFNLKNDVVMIGDSHTEFIDWQAAFPGKSIANRGVGGDTTRAVLARQDTILSVSAKTAVIMLGTNDVFSGVGVADILYNYHTIVNNLRDHGSHVIVISTPYTNNKRHSSTIAAIDKDLSAFCRITSCAFIDINILIASDGLIRGDRTIDGVHLNGDGYADWVSSLAPYL